mmetsp:Transcript_63373/g.168781  ORF Transcript_63373/g.168781 Transcript_63373/m.168781 type:complete len:80 (-) Transcript_63373:71-310(-)
MVKKGGKKQKLAVAKNKKRQERKNQDGGRQSSSKRDTRWKKQAQRRSQWADLRHVRGDYRLGGPKKQRHRQRVVVSPPW